MRRLPRDNALDSSFAWLADPYGFVGKRCDRLGTDLFEARIALRRTICMRGREAVELFYDPRRFVRHGALPEALLATLYGHGGVQTLDGAAHAHRKALFTRLLSAQRSEHLAEHVARAWKQAAEDWQGRRRVVLYDEAQQLLARAACAWAGVPLAPHEVPRRARQLAALFDSAATLQHLRARAAREACELWLSALVQDVRNGTREAPRESALDAVARFREPDGQPLSPRVAAVELLNLLRPAVAVSVFVVFAAHALHEYPQWVATVQRGRPEDLEVFVQEVRRFYPFVPAVLARSRAEFEWRGWSFRQGRRVMLDLYGTNHDPRLWEAPDEFRPERFRGVVPDPSGFVPQGGGDVNRQHRCPGEGVTVALMRLAVDWLARRLGYDVPAQDLRLDMGRLPALPRSRFIIQDVTPIPQSAWPSFAFTPS